MFVVVCGFILVWFGFVSLGGSVCLLVLVFFVYFLCVCATFFLLNHRGLDYTQANLNEKK